MKRPSIINLMSHRQVINCPTEMKEIKEMAIAYQSSAWNNFCNFCYFCGTYKKKYFLCEYLVRTCQCPSQMY